MRWMGRARTPCVLPRAVLIVLATIGLAAATASCGGTRKSPAADKEQTTLSSAARPCTTEAERRTGVPSSTVEARDSRVAVPNLEGNDLGTALCRVLAVGLRVAIPSYGSASDDRLENIIVVRTSPSSGTEVEPGSVVTFEEFTGLIPSSLPPVPDEHPASVRVPNLVGLRYSEAVDVLDIGLVPSVRASELPPLPPEASVRGLDAYVVQSQSPEPGAELPYLTTNPTTSSVVLMLSLGR